MFLTAFHRLLRLISKVPLKNYDVPKIPVYSHQLQKAFSLVAQKQKCLFYLYKIGRD